MTACTSSEPAEDADQSKLPRVTVPLLGSTRDVRGIELAEALHSERIGGAHRLEPTLLTVRLINGRELTLPVRSISLHTRNGIVTSIYARRPMQPMRFKETVADLRRTMKALGIEPDDNMNRRIAGWGDNNPGYEEGANPNFDLYKAGIDIVPEIGHFHVHVKPDPERGWFYLMNFGASVEASRAAQAAAKTDLLLTEPTGRGVAATASSSTFSQVNIRLGGPVTEAGGVQFLPTRASEPARSAEVTHPHALTIELPGDRKPLLLLARNSSFSSHDGIVGGITIHRPMLPLPYEKAISDLLRIVKAIGIDAENIDAKLNAGVSRAERRSISIELPNALDGIDMEIKVKPEPEDAWSYSLELQIKRVR